MPTMQAIIQLLLIAIASVAIISAGVKAVDESLKSVVISKKNSAIDYCRVKIEQRRTSERIMEKYVLEDMQSVCEGDEKTKIDADFATAFVYISCFKEALLQQEASGSVTTTSASPSCQLPVR